MRYYPLPSSNMTGKCFLVSLTDKAELIFDIKKVVKYYNVGVRGLGGR